MKESKNIITCGYEDKIQLLRLPSMIYKLYPDLNVEKLNNVFNSDIVKFTFTKIQSKCNFFDCEFSLILKTKNKKDKYNKFNLLYELLKIVYGDKNTSTKYADKQLIKIKDITFDFIYIVRDGNGKVINSQLFTSVCVCGTGPYKTNEHIGVDNYLLAPTFKGILQMNKQSKIVGERVMKILEEKRMFIYVQMDKEVFS